MAVLSKQHKFLMVHITKCAGTSMSEALCDATGYAIHPTVKKQIVTDGIGGGVHPQLSPFKIGTHDPISTIYKKVGGQVNLDEYFKFCFVRNPWDRIYSFYQHKKRRKDADLPKHNGRFLEFNEVLLSSNVLLLQPQLWWICDDDGNEKMDFIGRHESLKQDFRFVCDEIGLEYNLQHRNNSNSKVSYRDVYSKETQRLIYYHYQHEIERFGYKFDS